MSGLRFTPGYLYDGLGGPNSNPINETMQPRTEAPSSETNSTEGREGGGFVGFISSAGKFIRNLNLGKKEEAPKKDNSTLIITSIGLALVVLLVIVVFLTSKK